MTSGLPGRFRELRLRKGMSSTALAYPQYSVSYVSQIERGLRNPSREALQYFARRLGVSVGFLETGIPDDLPLQLRYEIEEGQRDIAEDHPEAAEQRARAVLLECERFEMPGVRAMALSMLGEALHRQSKYRDAIDAFEQAQRVGLTSARHTVATISGLARAYRAVGDLKYATQVIESFLDAEHEIPLDSTSLPDLHTVLVSLYFERGDMLRAERAAVRALEAVDQQTPPYSQAKAYWTISRVLAERKQWEEALAYADRARMLYESVDNRREAGKLHTAYAFLSLESEPPRIEQAREHLEKAEAVLAEAGAAPEIAYVHTERSRLGILVGDHEEALVEARLASTTPGIPDLERGRALFLEGRALAALGQTDQAREVLRRAIEIFRADGARQQEASCWREIGELDVAEESYVTAVDSFRAGLEALDPRRSRA
jgi:tetratricopeptide (TPR) repeat protein